MLFALIFLCHSFRWFISDDNVQIHLLSLKLVFWGVRNFVATLFGFWCFVFFFWGGGGGVGS